jgi:hypothetical protein
MRYGPAGRSARYEGIDRRPYPYELACAFEIDERSRRQALAAA